MSSEPNQTDPQAEADDALLKLNDQLDSLVEQLQEAEAAKTSEDPGAETTAQAESSDNLDGQIQNMLEEAQSDSELGTDQGALAAKESDQSEPDPADSQMVDQLDQALAAQADDMVAGDFKTVEEILSAEPEAESAEAGSEFKTIESPVEAAFESIEELLAAAEGTESQGFDADAGDVARELDQQQSDTTASTPEAKKTRVLDPARFKAFFAAVVRAVVRSERVLYRVCALINIPLLHRSPETRNLVGYVALLTLFNASILLVFKLASSMFAE